MIGVLSALPIIAAGNLCCCLWVASGGLVAAYLLQQARPDPISRGDGALVGFQAGMVGAVTYALLSIPITALIAPMQRELLARLAERAEGMPPEFREYLGSYVGGPAGIAFGFLFMLVAGAVFSTVGGVVGAVLFQRPAVPGAGPPPPPN